MNSIKPKKVQHMNFNCVVFEDLETIAHKIQ